MIQEIKNLIKRIDKPDASACWRTAESSQSTTEGAPQTTTEDRTQPNPDWKNA